jgi:hypothetical protein
MQTCVRIKKDMGHRCISGSKSFICLKNYRNFLPPQSDFEKKTGPESSKWKQQFTVLVKSPNAAYTVKKCLTRCISFRGVV